MRNCRIGKVTCKKTGKQLDMISPKLADCGQVALLQDALKEVRKGNALAVGVFVKTESRQYTNYTGRYDHLSAGSSNLAFRISKAWEENGS